MFTTSPSAVKSSTAPAGPVGPTYAIPRVDPAAQRDRTARGRVGPADALEQLASGGDRRGRVVGPGDPAEEQPDDLVADELVDDPVVVEDRLRPDLVEVAEECHGTRSG